MSQKSFTKPAVQVLPYAWVILAVVYLASVAAPLNQFKVPPIMPVLMQELGIDLAGAGSLMSVIVSSSRGWLSRCGRPKDVAMIVPSICA